MGGGVAGVEVVGDRREGHAHELEGGSISMRSPSTSRARKRPSAAAIAMSDRVASWAS